MEYGRGIWNRVFNYCPIIFLDNSTTNPQPEWLCTNLEVEFLEAPLGTEAFKTASFGYTRVETSPVFVAFDDISIDKGIASKTKSLFLFRIGTASEIITVSNYDKEEDNMTTAPPIDGFSRECLSWFSSDVDWLIGFGTISNSITSLIVEQDGIITTKSADLLDSIIPESTRVCNHSLIQISGSTTTETPFVTVSFETAIEFSSTLPSPSNLVFLYNSESTVALCAYFTAPITAFSYNKLETEIRWDSDSSTVIVI